VRIKYGLAVLVLCIALSACGGGGGGGSVSPPIGGAPPTTAPTAPPASGTAGDVRGIDRVLTTPTIAFDDDDQTLFVAQGRGFVTYGGSSAIGLPSADASQYITSANYSHAARALYFSGLTTVYRATTSGVVTTVGTGFTNISGIVVDPSGTVYVVDGDHVSTVVGGSAKQLTPAGTVNTMVPGIAVAAAQLAYDTHDGALYLTDPYDTTLKRVTTTGSVTVVAGSCIPFTSAGYTTCWAQMRPGTGTAVRFGNLSGIAYDASTDLFYVSDAADNVVWAVTPSGTATIAAGYGAYGLTNGNGRRALLVAPVALTLSASGTLYMDEVDRFGGTSEISTFATTGSPPQPYTFPVVELSTPTQPSLLQGLRETADGNAWVTEGYGSNIAHVTPAGVTEYALPAGFFGPFRIAVDADGGAWATAERIGAGNGLSWGVVSVSPAGATKGYTIDASSLGVQINGIATGPDGNPWFSTYVIATPAASIDSIDRSTGTVTDHPIGTAPAGALATGPDGNIWFGTSGTNGPELERMSLAGQLVGQPFSVKSGPIEMVTNPVDHALWYVDGASTLGKVDESGVETDAALRPIETDPLDLAVAPDGTIWFSEDNLSDIAHLDATGAITRYYLPGSNEGPGPTGIAVRSDGKIWVATYFGSVYLFDPSAYDALGMPHFIESDAAKRSPRSVDRRALYGHTPVMPLTRRGKK
jgi:virginiamycin B lyase